jgi:hypothetical protein
MRDAAGEYYCPDCWPAAAAQGGRPAEFTCRLCGEFFSMKELAPDAKGVCLTCRAARDGNPETLLSAASDFGGEHATFQPEAETFSQHQARLRRRHQVRVAMWVGGAVVVVVVILAIALYGR